MDEMIRLFAALWLAGAVSYAHGAWQVRARYAPALTHSTDIAERAMDAADSTLVLLQACRRESTP